MENGDEWFASDKLYHFLFCFFITAIVSLLASRTPYPFIRRRSILLGSLASLAAGFAKETADEFGFFQSAGASAKDFVADLVGIAVAALALSFSKSVSFRRRPKQSGVVEMV